MKKIHLNYLTITKSSDLKRAFSFLFYDYTEKQEGFIKNLSKKTKANLEINSKSTKRNNKLYALLSISKIMNI